MPCTGSFWLAQAKAAAIYFSPPFHQETQSYLENTSELENNQLQTEDTDEYHKRISENNKNMSRKNKTTKKPPHTNPKHPTPEPKKIPTNITFSPFIHQRFLPSFWVPSKHRQNLKQCLLHAGFLSGREKYILSPDILKSEKRESFLRV